MSAAFLMLGQLGRDFLASLARWPMWSYIGWNDIAQQYRRSFIGPVWITLSTGIFIVGFSIIGASLFNTSAGEYVAYFASGYVFFQFLVTTLTDACNIFIHAEAFLKQLPMPKLVFVFRCVTRNSITLLHNLVIVVLVLAWYGTLGAINLGGVLAALLLTLTALFLAAGTLGAVCARFRDVPLMVATFMQLAFFITPVMWRFEQLDPRIARFMYYNPLAHFVELVRQPLMGLPLPAQFLHAAMADIGILLVAFVLIVGYARGRIVYWL